MRIVITIPDLPANPAAAALMVDGAQMHADLDTVANDLAAYAGELRPGLVGWINGSPATGIRLHWRLEKG